MSEEHKPFAQWAILELMGHRRLGGYVEEEEIAGQGMLRIDVPGGPDGQEPFTQYYAMGAVYCLTPTTEDLARRLAARSFERPVRVYELPAPAEGEEDMPI